MFNYRFAFGAFLITRIASMTIAAIISSGNIQEIKIEEPYNTKINSSEVCTNSACVSAAKNILQNMDKNVDPCDDFYQFTCKKFIEKTKIPDDQAKESIFSKVNDRLKKEVLNVLESPVTDDDIRPFKLVKYLYKACMNTSLIEAIGTTYVTRLFKKLGGWPVLEGDGWNDRDFDWKETVYTSSRIGFSTSYFIKLEPQIDFRNSSIIMLTIEQASLGIPRSYLVKGLEDDFTSKYYNFMVNVAVLFGANRSRAEEELKQSLEFEISLAKISLPDEEMRDPYALYNLMTITELEGKFPSIPWLTFVRTLVPNETIQRDEVIVVSVPSYIKHLESLLSNTSKRVLGNYALTRAALDAVQYLPDEFNHRNFEFIKLFSGNTVQVPRWRTCVSSCEILNLAVSAMYVRKFYNKETKNDVIHMVNKIRSRVYEMLENVNWMDNQTRAAALAKAKAMTNIIAYPDELLDDPKLEKFYENLEIDPNDYYGSILNFNKFDRIFTMGLLRKPVNKTDWTFNTLVIEVNAKYDRADNSLIFSAGILRGQFFNKDFPRYLNYGAIGTFIGHEITHGFDDQGRHFDKDGNLVDWWHDETKKKYLDRAACIVQQYGNYTVKAVNMTLNGIKTQGENIADNGGIKLAYQAYISWMLENGQESRLPGLEMFSPQQMFWIGAASSWCSVNRPEALKNDITVDNHSPFEFRVIGPFSNQEEFSRDFNCPIGSRMNPANKCHVW